MKVDFLLKTLRDFNEDQVFIAKNIFVLIDGASPLGKKQYPDLVSDTFWLHSFIQKHLKDAIKPKLFLKKVTKDLIKNYQLQKDSEYNMPSAGIALAAIKNNYLILASVGDCPIFIETKNNKNFMILNSPLLELDKFVIKKMFKIAKENNFNKIFDARKNVEKDIINNRSKLNSKHGYGVLTPKKIPNKFINIKKFKLNKLKTVFLMTDGFYQYVDTLNLGDNLDLIRILKSKNGLQKAVNDIFNAQKNDKSGFKYPRLKFSDDCGIIKIDFS